MSESSGRKLKISFRKCNPVWDNQPENIKSLSVLSPHHFPVLPTIWYVVMSLFWMIFSRCLRLGNFPPSLLPSSLEKDKLNSPLYLSANTNCSEQMRQKTSPEWRCSIKLSCCDWTSLEAKHLLRRPLVNKLITRTTSSAPNKIFYKTFFF